jgi:hypothetical protein
MWSSPPRREADCGIKATYLLRLGSRTGLVLSSLYPPVLDTANVRLGVGVHLHATDKGRKVLSSSSDRSRWLKGSGITGSGKEIWDTLERTVFVAKQLIDDYSLISEL